MSVRDILLTLAATRAPRCADLSVVLEAATLLTLSRVALSLLPGSAIAQLLGKPGTASARPRNEEVARRVARSLTVASRLILWQPTCLDRALVGKVMLARRGVPSTIHLGVARAVAGFAAHAWLRCGDVMVVGGDEAGAFTELASLA